jgi:predicted ATPase
MDQLTGQQIIHTAPGEESSRKFNNFDIKEQQTRKFNSFITLIDELYNHHYCLICLAVSSIDDLFQGTEEGPLFDLER